MPATVATRTSSWRPAPGDLAAVQHLLAEGGVVLLDRGESSIVVLRLIVACFQAREQVLLWPSLRLTMAPIPGTQTPRAYTAELASVHERFRRHHRLVLERQAHGDQPTRHLHVCARKRGVRAGRERLRGVPGPSLRSPWGCPCRVNVLLEPGRAACTSSNRKGPAMRSMPRVGTSRTSVP